MHIDGERGGATTLGQRFLRLDALQHRRP